MKFKSILILFSLVVYSECNWHRIKKHVVKHEIDDLENNYRDNQPKISSAVGVNVNLVLSANLVQSWSKDGPKWVESSLAVDTTTNDFWAVGRDCKSTFCKGKKHITANTKTIAATKGNHVQGLNTTNTYLVLSEIETNKTEDQGLIKNIIAANYLDPLYAKKLDSKVTGVMGIGPSAVIRKNIEPGLIVTLYLGKRNSTALYINTVEPTLSILPRNDTPFYIKSESSKFWKISLDFISTYTDSKKWCELGCSAVIDTTYNGISGPAEDIIKLYEYLGADEDGNIDCYKKDLIMPLIFHMRGKRYKLHPKNFIVKSDDGYDKQNSCKTVFEVNYNYKRMWRIGLPFLQEFLTFFNFQSGNIAFVPLPENINIDFTDLD